jgi:hypothetical protein
LQCGSDQGVDPLDNTREIPGRETLGPPVDLVQYVDEVQFVEELADVREPVGGGGDRPGPPGDVRQQVLRDLRLRQQAGLPRGFQRESSQGPFVL